jgi:hypothetical protein
MKPKGIAGVGLGAAFVTLGILAWVRTRDAGPERLPLPPLPPIDAPLEEQRAYERRMRAEATAPAPTSKAGATPLDSKRQQGFEARQAEAKRRADEALRNIEERLRRIHEKLPRDPNRPKPEPLFPTPEFGPAVDPGKNK